MVMRNFPRSLGPFENARQAVKASVGVKGASSTPERTAHIMGALETANVGTGDYDRVIARWLGTWEPEVVGTVIDWVFRAYEAGVHSGAKLFELTATLNRVPTDEEIDALYEAGLSDSSVEYGPRDARVYVARTAYSRDEAADSIAAQVATVADLRVIEVEDAPDEDEPPAPARDVTHALPPIDYPGRLAGATPGPRCGAQGRTALFAADVSCPACLADMAQDGGQR